MSDTSATTRPGADRELADFYAQPDRLAAESEAALGLDRRSVRSEVAPWANNGSRSNSDVVVEAYDLLFAHPPSFRLEIEALRLRAGSILGLLGPNGSGKTTLLRLLGLTIRPHAGEILLGGRPVRYGWRGLGQRREVATVFQNPILLDTTVRANVEAGLRFRGVRRHERRRMAENWLDRFGIAHLADRRARMLSGGETRRVALARALVLEPKLLLLDEPFNDLDREVRQELQVQLRHVLDGTRTAVVLVTHDLHEGLGLAERLAVLLAGRLVQHGSLREVLDQPATVELASLVGMTNLWAGRVSGSGTAGSRVVLDDATQLVSRRHCPEQRVLVGIRPERLRFVAQPDQACGGNDQSHLVPAETDFGSKEIVLAGTVISVEPATPLVRIRVRLRRPGGAGGQGDCDAGSACAEVIDLPERVDAIRVGQPVWLSVRPEDVHLMGYPSVESSGWRV